MAAALVASTLLLLGFLYTLGHVTVPFVVALIISYLLNPAVTMLARYTWSRSIASLILLGLFFWCAGTIALMLIPIVHDQLIKLSHTLVNNRELLVSTSTPFISELKGILPDIVEKIESSLNSLSSYIVTFTIQLLQSVYYSGVAAINVLALMFITPIVTFYTLRDWPQIVRVFDTLIPRKYVGVVHEILFEVDQVLSRYIRGQFLVCIILSFYYSTLLSIIGLNSAIIIGTISGLLTFIPYAGPTFCATLAMLIAIMQFQNIQCVPTVLLIFVAGQLLEGNIITPKILGSKIGLHPVYIMLGLLVGGALFGFLGVLLALPGTAIIGVLTRFAIRKYKGSAFYVS